MSTAAISVLLVEEKHAKAYLGICLMAQLLIHKDNFSKLIIAEKIHTACYYSNGCRGANNVHRSSAAAPVAGVGAQFRFFI